MPLFDYKCSNCEAITESLVKSSDVKEIECPKCGGKAVQQVAIPAVHFVGTGWPGADSKPLPGQATPIK